MFIEYEVNETDDFVDMLIAELFPHATTYEAMDCILKLITAYFEYYKPDKLKLSTPYGVMGGNHNEDS